MNTPPLSRMDAYGAEHLVMLALIAMVCVLAVRWARRAPAAQVDRALRITGWLLLVNAVFWTLWGLMPWAWNLEESLPLHFSDALRFVLPIALITQAHWAIVIAYFWGLTLNMMSVLTPDLNYFVSVPLEFAQYWVAHGAGVVVPVVLVWGLGYRPTWRGYGLALGATLGWALIAVTGNALTGANYGYLNRAPAGPSILDLLGPWPQYLLVEAALIAVAWSLMTLPWTLRDRGLGTPFSGPDRLLRRSRPTPGKPAVAAPSLQHSGRTSRSGGEY